MSSSEQASAAEAEMPPAVAEAEALDAPTPTGAPAADETIPEVAMGEAPEAVAEVEAAEPAEDGPKPPKEAFVATEPAASKPDDDAVRVGIRIRPLLSRDRAEGAREILHKTAGEPQVTIGGDRSFTYDHVFELEASQKDVYSSCMADLVAGVLKGYNATVLAYGQTGSGKTHTMGTAAATEGAAPEDMENISESCGVIPRALADLFARASANSDDGITCQASASFIEIYKEEVHDLLNWSAESESLATLPIRENPDGGIALQGQKVRKVSSVAEAMAVLQEGSKNRATGSTSMNATSSRSHAIFTVSLELSAGGRQYSPKLHFVDLAGSERAKRTGASGERLQEGIQINKGLLALGNVINALCERLHHVPYRDSKLTRLLQDSLGGNSRTLMLACVSPGDADMEETLNTLKYANRARQIKNKPLVVQDPMQARIAELQDTVAMLTARLAHYEGGGAPLPPLVPAGGAPVTAAALVAAGGAVGSAAPPPS